MVRTTLNIQMPSAGLNTELSDLADVPQYSKDELNMDILSDGSRARRLGLEYERGYKLSNVAAAESIMSDNGQIVKIRKGFSCYEWTNYKGDGKSLLAVQIGDKVCFFKGINNGVLSDEEIDYQVDLTQFAITGSQLYGWTITAEDETFIGYTDSQNPSVGAKVYRDRAKEDLVSTVVSVSGGTYTLADDSTMVYNSSANIRYLSNDYQDNPVSFASAYGTLFICSPYIDVIRVKFKETYTYTYTTQPSCSISLSPFYDTGYQSVWTEQNPGSSIYYGRTSVTIKLKDGTTSTFYPFNYGSATSWSSTSSFVNAFNNAPSAVRLGITVTGDGKKTYRFTAPSDITYNGATITMNCAVSSTYLWKKHTFYMDGYGRSDEDVRSVRPATGTLTGGTETGVTVQGYTEATRVTPMVRDTSGIEEPGHPSNDTMPSTLTNEHMYNLLNQGWDGSYTRVDDHTCTPGSGKIADFKSSRSVYPPNALSWYVLKDANGAFAPATVTNHAFGSSLAPRGKIILNAYSLDRGVASGVTPIPPSPYYNHRPDDICFFAGRLWYALDGRVLYSQIISEDTTLAEKCYQAADPTSEDVSDPIDTDGGVMNIQQCGKILRLAQLGNGLCVFGDKGVVSILPGNATGFTPTSYYQQLVSSVGTVSKRAVISVGDAIYYWSALGIYKVSFNENGQLIAENISFGTIHTFFKNLKPVSIENCIAKLNSIKNEIHFMYPTNEDTPKELNAVLKYNVITNTWTPRNVLLTEQSSPFIIDAVEIRNPIDTKPRAIVESEGSTVYVNGDVCEIKKKDEDYVGFDSLSYLVLDGNSMRVTFANCTNIEHKDWTIGDVIGNGYNYTSYLVTHPIVFQDIYLNKQAPYITTTYKRSEEGALFQSGCFMSSHWGWSLNPSSFEWDSKQQTYRPTQYDEHREFVLTKTRVRGSGKALQLKFENDGSKDFRLCAIGIDARGYRK